LPKHCEKKVSFNLGGNNLGIRYYGVMKGYELGVNFLDDIAGGAVMQRISTGATILGLMVLGVMTATMVRFRLVLLLGKVIQQ